MAYPRTNPPHRHAGSVLSAASEAVLRESCFDCHSNETAYPWYARLPVANIVMGRHVRKGRGALNFSLWDAMGAGARREAIAESLESVREGEMPTWDYTLLHPAARVDAGELATLARDGLRVHGVTGADGREERGGHDDEDED